MKFITILAHAGHDHHEVIADNTSSAVMIGGIVGLAIIAAALLIFLNFRKSPIAKSTDERDES